MRTAKQHGWSKAGLLTVLCFVVLAIIVDSFAVPNLQAQGKGLLTALFEGTLSVTFCAGFLVFLVLKILQLFTKRRP